MPSQPLEPTCRNAEHDITQMSSPAEFQSDRMFSFVFPNELFPKQTDEHVVRKPMTVAVFALGKPFRKDGRPFCEGRIFR